MSLRSAVASASRPLAPRFARAASTKVKAKPTKAKAKKEELDPNWILPEIHLGRTHPSRYGDHYEAALASDLLYMTYDHRAWETSAKATAAALAKAAEPKIVTGYEANRPTPPPKGNRPPKPMNRALVPEDVVHLEAITVHTMVKEAIGNKNALLSAIMALRAISGESARGGGRTGAGGVEVVASRNGAAAFKLRAGMPVAAKVELRGEAMYDFLQSLVDFVLPRIREFPGFVLPPMSASKTSPSALAGVVSLGLPPAAMGLFPQVAANIDAYPKLHGFHMYFKTNARGRDAQEHARALLTGFRIPFHRKS
ncbi:hypothetical protein CspeluHIS016_0701110 [Cutaneotrichosporon spelunceum]|uniref:Large ribosomal subunit protein uL5 C-terminal domain-containing protein n=1 Tax=Cutaneotrichosporon spelunceum TaxID=1672016 RepID=A0AAD3TY96_9TREE|nr:hypothetical protein CspeluHIS016_0701110 [Cutaneotrichosporon spelunceum]